MTDELTCGKGLAASSALPAKIAELTTAVAEILERHMKALDLSDENSRRERALYDRLAREHRDSAAALADTAERMAAARDLPMGAHDMAAMADPAMGAAFERFVRLEEELLQLLQSRLDEDRTLLSAMRDEGDWAS
ncbi:MAG TPA: hypothetical protein VFT04_02000 [Gemmatimonadales bacterium]|nr:hypothetical protein [Gemmatimonadales bacterium]